MFIVDPVAGKLCVIGLAVCALALGADRPSGRLKAGRSAVLGRNGMVAASQPLAAQAGLQLLRQGGNAFDAAVGAAAVLAVVEPMMTGPGGDLFAIAHVAKTGKLVGLNASGFSPKAVDRDFFKNKDLDQIPIVGPFSVSVPGAVDGWATLVAEHGNLSLAEVLAPAIEYAEEGFAVSEIIGGDWVRSGPNHASRAEFSRVYLKNGEGYAHGDVFRNPDLARTLRQIAQHGRDWFYEGEFAERMAAHLSSQGWPMTTADIANQHSDWVEPISTTYKGYEVFELPPNGQGMAALEILNILSDVDMRGFGHNSADYIHHFVEAKKLAFADLDAWLSDPERTELPTSTIISKDYGQRQRERIDPVRAGKDVKTGVDIGAADTIYLTVVDKDRNAVSLINSVFHGFGSGVVVPGTGVILQNRGALFNLTEGHPNVIEPRKRPYHTIIPAMVYRDGKPWLSFGVMGGDMQPQGHAQILLNMIEFGMNVQEAGEAARIRHHPDFGVSLEHGVDPEAIRDLVHRGHEIAAKPGGFGGYQAIRIDWDNGVLIGGTDPRKDGLVAAW